MGANFKVVIPARFASTRLPGKPLIKILDKPMIEWVYQAAKASLAGQVIVATDDERIIQAARKLKDEGLAEPVVLGKSEQVEAAIEKAGVNIDGITVIDPKQICQSNARICRMICFCRHIHGLRILGAIVHIFTGQHRDI